MLYLKNITKDYVAGDTVVHALKGINLEFRDNEFVSILGQSGCGKTTMLNILGGLDRYTNGDLIINKKSTKDFKDKDWDTYRNRSIGFVFQNYNLIPHQTVLSNVELALTLSGVSKAERQKRAIEVLEKVGLGDQINKKPNQISGGQMQRVAIARSLINDPDILLADEPTGALDSDTSIQIMEILKEISKDKLIIMVTHNPELAEKYSSRIIRLLDGQVISDTNPYESGNEDVIQNNKLKKEKTSMSFKTALSLSLNNLLTKKTRTFMTAFAGSIGIIGISLILSLSNGFQNYINKIQEDTLSTYPLTIEQINTDIGTIITSIQDAHKSSGDHENDKVYSQDIMGNILEATMAESKNNDLKSFKKYLEENNSTISSMTNAVSYNYNIDLNIYQSDYSKGVKQINPVTFLNNMGGGSSDSGMPMMPGMGNSNVWTELLDNEKLLKSQYDVVAGKWPEGKEEIVLILDKNNEVTDYDLYALGLKDVAEIENLMKDMLAGKKTNFSPTATNYSYEDILKLTYKVVLKSDCYKKSGDVWADMSKNQAFMKKVLDNSLKLNIVGIIKPNEEVKTPALDGTIGYSSELTKYVINQTNKSDIAKAQLKHKDIDVFTNKDFATSDTANQPQEDFDISSLPDETKQHLATLSPEEQQALLASYSTTSPATYEENLKTLGIAQLNSPNMISIYPKDFKSKEEVEDFIKDYNKSMTDKGKEQNTIEYTDYIGLMMSSVSTIINSITYVLIAFVGISLVVSSIMIGIITYVSVLERTKEIGILKSIGASKKDISRVFNAETLIIGFVSGILGIIITLILNIPINMVIKSITEISGVSQLPIIGGVVLILLSMSLTLIAGLIPSKVAAKKDPVVALRTE